MTPGDPQKGSLLRVYYPTLEQCLEEHDKWPIWAEDKYITGLLTFMQVRDGLWRKSYKKNVYSSKYKIIS
jgi:hypothetical protein